MPVGQITHESVSEISVNVQLCRNIHFAQFRVNGDRAHRGNFVGVAVDHAHGRGIAVEGEISDHFGADSSVDVRAVDSVVEDVSGIDGRREINITGEFVDGIDPDLLKGIFSKQFDGIDDLADEAAVNDRLKSFREANKGLILSEQGGGTGRTGIPAGGIRTARNPWKKETFNLTEQISIAQTNPAEAERLKAEADATNP